VSFKSGETSLHALVFKPDGSGPYPVIIWNHSHRKPLLQSDAANHFGDIAKLFVEHGYVLMITDRRERTLGFQDGDAEDQEAQLCCRQCY